ncbi:phosphonate ABC transporter, permease protein PhnE [Hoeflea prorocentri]|uniref:Phosphonate ABC transporter, permease protein PhnE n=1 Tax=Hoeflea prorocentri TaxID=1922333 RepID=A0A9X3ZI43_9HYPH|nr:phosphonate ABC transporter, permease protein PhnE [Hoeflea prorocentri]MCY6382034.1 phosphonate ABC transporter, permease protein PhnE [Hoeflea prorocentri]MDA5399834.1 phosphonate ABC transporter, permease protein PhnE [Hoeflea prorocentri]
MKTPSADTIDSLASRHEAVFHRPVLERWRAPIILTVVGAYLIFAWSLFGIGTAFKNGNWDIAGNYLADWISYEVRPDIEYDGDYLQVEFPRFSPLGSDPDPVWLRKTTDNVEREVIVDTGGGIGTETSTRSRVNSFMMPGAPGTQEGGTGDTSLGNSFMAPQAQTARPAEEINTSGRTQMVTQTVVTRVDLELGPARINIEPGQVSVDYHGETFVVDVVPDTSVTANGPLPQWAQQMQAGGDILMKFGFAGTLEVENDEVKVRHRFLGWENFWFDTASPFWGMGFAEVMRTISSGDRIKPEMSNLALAWDNFLYNAEWQHADVWIKLLQTIVMAFVGTLFATLLAFPLSFAAARNITRSWIANQFIKRLFDFLRCVDMLIWALFFTRAFGPGPLAGISAIFFTDTGTLGKLYAEALENVDDKQREGIRSVGASPVLVQRYGVVPQVLPVFASQSLYFWESNTRSATIIGAVGAGGIGLKLWEAMRTNADWENVAYMVLLVLATVFIFDSISNAIRSRLIGREPKAA